MNKILSDRYLLLPTILLITSCSLGTTKIHDQMCPQLAAFAAMTMPGQSHSVVLRGGWGGDTPNTIVTHDCNYFAYNPGDDFCAYLVPNTSWEFGNYNAKRVAACLDSPTREDFIDRMDNYRIPAEITSSLQILTDKKILVTVRLEENSNLSVLTLLAIKK